MKCPNCGKEAQSESRGSERAGTFRWIKVCWGCRWQSADPGPDQRQTQHMLQRAGVRYHTSARQRARERDRDSSTPVPGILAIPKPAPAGTWWCEKVEADHQWQRVGGHWICSACDKIATVTTPDKPPCPGCGASKPQSEYLCETCLAESE